MKPSGLFHQLTGLTSAEKSAGSIREFLGDGTAYLRVPGLTKVTSVQIGRTAIPLEQDYQFPHNGNFPQKVQITFPFVDVQPGPDGVAVLLRSKDSNDGIWQAGQKIYVGGEWEEEVSPDDAQDTASSLPPLARQLSSLTLAELKTKATQSGINIPANTAKQQVINILCDAAKNAQSDGSEPES